ncbi:uncharacterized protein LOC128558290 [Mercenaria mercenaria]|uniref:uncharacterized protein LOC128558290 n=1 Tax=Mercenaria mercenaria TaxID=6596 RepID=UPI00234E5552|nr:uncharacterized protein LOC128558290 [Mercenaria mercenaria]
MDFLNKDGNLDEGLLDLLFDENMVENLDDFPTVEIDFKVLTEAPSTAPSNKFKAVPAEDVENFLETNQNKNTKRKTTGDINLFQLNKPRAYAVADPQKDPVHLFKTYSSKRPDEMKDPDSPFFLSVANKAPQNMQAWYKKEGMGINRIYGIMKEMKTAANVEFDKRITPYSVRKHLIQKLNDKGIPSHHIMQISGHKNVNSLNNYSKLNPGQSKDISDILANTTGIPDSNERRVVPLGPLNTTNQEMNIPASASSSLHRSVGFEHQQLPMLAYSTFNGPVTFKFDNTSSRTMHQTAVSHSQYHGNAGNHEQTSISNMASPVSSPQPRRWKRIRCISSSSDSE